MRRPARAAHPVPNASAYLPVRVLVRVRPLLAKEKLNRARSCVGIRSGVQVVLGGDRSFTFDGALDERVAQEAVFDDAVLPLVEGCFQGYNGTVLAYGQTGSGKTYTMGTGLAKEQDGRMEHLEKISTDAGIAPRVCELLFKRIEQCKAEAEFLVKVSYLEVYNENIRDLLASTAATDPPKLFIHEENSTGCIHVSGAEQVAVRTPGALMAQLQIGAAHRTVGSTEMNASSSRSHALITISVEQRGYANPGKVLRGKLHLVDLAGSERNKRTKARGVRFRESIRINQGLLSLGNVINALSTRPKEFVPYRQSKLTRLIQDSLGGNSNTVFIACISPAGADFAESLNTLKYAQRARDIKNLPVVNDIREDSEMEQMDQDIASLTLSGAMADKLIQHIRSDTISDSDARLLQYERNARGFATMLLQVKEQLLQLNDPPADTSDILAQVDRIAASITVRPTCDDEVVKLKQELERTKEALAAAKSDLLRDEAIFAEKVAEMKRYQEEVEDVHKDREQMRLRLIELEELNGALTARGQADKKLAADLASKQKQLESLKAELAFTKRSNDRLKQELQHLRPRPKTTSTALPQAEEAMQLTAKAVESCVAQWFSAERLHREIESRNEICAERDACELSLSELEMKILRARASKQDSLEQLTTELTQLKLRRGPRLTAEIPGAEIRGLEQAIARAKADMQALEDQLASGEVLDEQDQLERQAIVDRLDALKAEEEFKSKEVNRLRETLREYTTLDEVVDDQFHHVQACGQPGLRAGLKLLVQAKIDSFKAEREQQRLEMRAKDNEVYITDLRSKMNQRDRQAQAEAAAVRKKFEEEKQALVRRLRGGDGQQRIVREMDEMYITGLENELFHAKKELLLCKHQLQKLNIRSQGETKRVRVKKAMLKEMPKPALLGKGPAVEHTQVNDYDEAMRVSRNQWLNMNLS